MKIKKSNVKIKNIKSSENTNVLPHKDTIEIREKRISIVFKVIYVVALFFVALFNTISKIFENGLTNIYIIESAVITFVLCLLVKMFVYVFNELRCLKIVNNDIEKLQSDKTENSYNQIFIYFYVGGFTLIMYTIILGFIKNIITQNALSIICVSSILTASILDGTNHGRNHKFLYCICCILWSTVVMNFFLFAGLK